MLLREKKDTHDGRLVKLHADKATGTHRGVIQHADVIGRQPRQIVQSNKGATYRIHDPTLAEYVRLTPRLVTPVRTYASSPNEGLRRQSRIDIPSSTHPIQIL